MRAFKVLTPGAFTTVQDLGRFGYQRMGVPVSGALDPFACQVANMLVGNFRDAAVLEITAVGPRLEFLNKTLIALTGAQMGMRLNDQPVSGWQSILVNSGDVLKVNQITSGCRAYLAISGGIDVPRVMGSRTTYVGGHMGGFKGRSLKVGDILKSGDRTALEVPRRLTQEWIPTYPEKIVLRAIPGPQNDFFREGLDTFFSSDYTVTPKADRMGYRLQGPLVHPLDHVPPSIISEPIMPGGIQISPDHQPIVLLVEQTVGGYTKIATVISPDLSRLAQAIPGDTVRFESVDLETAHRIYNEAAARLDRIATTLSNF